MKHGSISLTSFVACALLFACGDKPETAEPAPPAPAPAAEPAAPAAPAAPAEEPKERVDDPTFELGLAPVGNYASGQLGTVALTLKPRGEYHINQDYPISIALKSEPGIALAKTELKKAEAAEVTDHIARFDVPLTPQQAGTHKLEAKVKFAVCTPETCVPDERTLALALTVQ